MGDINNTTTYRVRMEQLNASVFGGWVFLPDSSQPDVYMTDVSFVALNAQLEAFVTAHNAIGGVPTFRSYDRS